jgi:uncharacterized membrane protein YtjA (UPF0391 family)
MRIETVDFAVSFAMLSSLFCAHSQSDAAAGRRMARRLDRRGGLRIGIADTPPRAYELPLSESAIHLKRRSTVMLYYAVVFFVIALVAAVLGFGGIAAGAAGIAKILFFVFLILAAVGFVLGAIRRT